MTDFPKVGDQFGAFLITGVVGHGGMGVVFSARQQPLNRPVALKVLDPRFTDDPGFVARFTREGELLATMNSPHVIQVFEHGHVGDCLYLAMQHVAGGDLAHYLRKNGPLSQALAADLTAQVASALADAHAVGIIHRDIKPSNVLLGTTGQDLFAYLCDFGIAQSAQSGLTQTGMLPGTLNFTAPERHEGHPADVRSDLYSLGCLWWCLLSGSNPYSGTDYQVAQQHFSAPVPQVQVFGAVEDSTNQLLERLMAKDPGRRPASAVEVVTALRGIQRLADTPGSRPKVTPRQSPLVPSAPAGSPTQSTEVAPVFAPRQTPPPVTSMAPPRVSPPPVARPPSRRTTSGARTAMTVGAIVVAAALVGGGSLWALSTVFSGKPTSTPIAVSSPPATQDATAEPSTVSEPTRNPVRKVSREVDVGTNPHGIAVNPVSRRAFVANYGDSSVSVVNLDSETVVREIDVGKNPQSVAVDPASGLLLVGCDGIPAVQIYDLQGYNLVGSISTGKGPIRIAVHSSQKVAYAVAQGSSTMQVISLTSHTLIRTVDVGSRPRVVEVDERDQIAYIGHWEGTTVSVIDLTSQSKISELTVGHDPNAIAIAPDARLAFVGSFGDGRDGGGSVSVIDLDTRAVKKTIDVDDGPSRLTVDEAAGVVYLTCLYARKVDVISVTSLSVTDRYSTAARPTGVAVDNSTGRLYLTSFDEHVVQVYAS